ncbi:MAG: 3-hydroxyacyl-CoA dehydrogenase NAD-binding domain-containing protein [Bacillota bacterium]
MIDSIVVIGAGTMGRSIAQFFLQNNVSVLLIDQNEQVIGKAKESIQLQLEGLYRKGFVKKEAKYYVDKLDCMDEIPETLHTSFLIEAIPENLKLKQDLFKRIEARCLPSTIIATNTSGLSISEIASVLKNPNRMIGTHFFTPAAMVPLVEVVKGEMTSDETAKQVMDLLSYYGKKPVLLKKDIPGFIGNRIQHAIAREAISLIEAGVVTAEEIDTVMRWSIGLRMVLTGPLEQRDLNGLDVHYDIASYLYKDLNNSTIPSPLLKEKVENGEIGLKTGKGFYDWDNVNHQAYLKQKEEQLMNLIQLLNGE